MSEDFKNIEDLEQKSPETERTLLSEDDLEGVAGGQSVDSLSSTPRCPKCKVKLWINGHLAMCPKCHTRFYR